MTRLALLPLVIGLSLSSASAQGVSQEYRVKAAYLYNFLKFVEWPEDATPGPVSYTHLTLPTKA